MTRLVWCSDVHLNFVRLQQRREFYHKINSRNPTHVLFTGDNAEAQNVCDFMTEVGKFVKAPVYFVLGNHDFYNGSIEGVRDDVKLYQDTAKIDLKYLPFMDPVPLNKSTCLIGVDGFYDGQYGDYWGSKLNMSDFDLIKDIAGLSQEQRYWKLAKIAKEEATLAESLLLKAFKKYDVVHFATHVPPFLEATWHRGQHSDDTWAPYFSCKAIGDVLLRLCGARPDKQVVVHCGHTHGEGVFNPLPNLIVYTSAARYGYPAISKVIDLC